MLFPELRTFPRDDIGEEDIVFCECSLELALAGFLTSIRQLPLIEPAINENLSVLVGELLLN